MQRATDTGAAANERTGGFLFRTIGVAIIAFHSCALLGAATGYLLHYVPGRLALLLSIVSLVLPGVLAAWSAKWLDAPRRAPILLIAFIGAAAFSYTFDVLRLATVVDFAVIPLTPAAMGDVVALIAEHGEVVHRITGERHPVDRLTTGVIQMSLVMIPLGSMLLSPVAAGLVTLRFPPFCGRCQRWLDRPCLVIRGTTATPAFRIKYQVSQGRYDELFQLTPIGAENEPHLRIELRRCATCGGDTFLRLVNVVIAPSIKADDQSEHRLIRNQRISSDVTDRFQQLAERGGVSATT